MKLKKVDAGVWVDVKDEKPIEEREYFIKVNGHKDVGIFSDKAFWSFDIKLDATHWLKPIKQVYVLTEDELKEYAKDILRSAGMFLREDLNPKFIGSIDKIEKAIKRK